MGSMGTVTFAKAAGTNVNAIDDVTPKVAEEAWDGAGRISTTRYWCLLTQVQLLTNHLHLI